MVLLTSTNIEVKSPISFPLILNVVVVFDRNFTFVLFFLFNLFGFVNNCLGSFPRQPFNVMDTYKIMDWP